MNLSMKIVASKVMVVVFVEQTIRSAPLEVIKLTKLKSNKTQLIWAGR